MSTIWISKESWQTLWSAIRNIQIRMDRTVLKPSAGLSGQGTSARIRIDLPLASGEGGIYDGPFKLTIDYDAKVLKIGEGFILSGSEFIVSPETELAFSEIPEIESGWLCVSVFSDVQFSVRETPDADHYPVAKISKRIETNSAGESLENIRFFQLHVPMAVLPETFDGPFRVTVNPDENSMTVAPGPVLANGFYFDTKETTLNLEEGYVCVHIELKENGEWSDPEILAGAEPGALNIPVALISHDVTESDDGAMTDRWKISQFRVPRAVFMIAGYECPIATGDET